MTAWRGLLERVLDREHLTEDEARGLLGVLTDPSVADPVKGAFLAALRAKGETADELRGFALGMRDAARRPALRPTGHLVDTCGTGGDSSGSINVSTAAALVVAACGVQVAKHGNRSVSSRSGSADVLEALGLRLSPDPEAAARLFHATGFTFLFAPSFHPAMAGVMPTRRSLGVRTVFNLLGPLTNPAAPPYQLVGAYSEPAARLLADTLAGLPITRAFVVHGSPSWDEATPFGPFVRFDVRPGAVHREEIDPRERYGLERHPPDALAGGDAAANAAALVAVFEGARGAHRDAILLNAALVLELCGDEPAAALARAAAAVDSGAVLGLLARLRLESHV